MFGKRNGDGVFKAYFECYKLIGRVMFFCKNTNFEK